MKSSPRWRLADGTRRGAFHVSPTNHRVRMDKVVEGCLKLRGRRLFEGSILVGYPGNFAFVLSTAQRGEVSLKWRGCKLFSPYRRRLVRSEGDERKESVSLQGPLPVVIFGERRTLLDGGVGRRSKC